MIFRSTSSHTLHQTFQLMHTTTAALTTIGCRLHPWGAPSNSTSSQTDARHGVNIQVMVGISEHCQNITDAT
ncbi:hypothetical protein ACHAW6_008610 [Cyclotella cf. meneghiniana]